MTSSDKQGRCLPRYTGAVTRMLCVLCPQVRFFLNSLLKTIASWTNQSVPWDKTKLYYVLREVRGCVAQPSTGQDQALSALALG